MKKVTKIDKVQNVTSKKQKLRVAAYCRVSTSNDAQLESLETQKAHYESYITSRDDWQFAGLYFDEGITGTKKDRRPELIRLMQDCAAKKIDFIITKSISRFSRNTTDCLELVRKLQELDVPIYFEKENINTGSMESELFLTILSSMAEGESTSISENSKWSIKKRFQNGTFKLSYAPYGYRWDGRTLRILPEQAKVVKRILPMFFPVKVLMLLLKRSMMRVYLPSVVANGHQPVFEAFFLTRNTPAMLSSRKPIPMILSTGIQTRGSWICITWLTIMKQLSAKRILKLQDF